MPARKYELPFVEYAPDEWSAKYIGSSGPYEVAVATLEILSPNPNGRGVFTANTADAIHAIIIADTDCEYLGDVEP